MNDSGLLPDPLSDDPTPDSLVEPTPQWYRRNGWRFGSMHLHMTASIIHVAICLAPLLFGLLGGLQISSWPKDRLWLILLWICVVALGYPTWAWVETMVFERWVRKLPEPQRKLERAHYQLHVGMAKNFWQAVMEIYKVAGLIGIGIALK